LKASPAQRRRRRERTSALRAQAILTFAAVRVAPALAVAGVAASRIGAGPAALLGVCVLACATALERRHYPLHLMPLGGALARALAPLAGVSLAWALSLTLDPLPLAELITPILAGWLVLAIVLVVIARLERGLGVRVAVIGSPALAASLASELEVFALRSWQIVGWIDFTADGQPHEGAGAPRLGYAEAMEAIVDVHAIDLIVFGVRESERDGDAGAADVSSIGVLERVVETCVGLEVRVIGANQFFEQAFGHVPLAAINAAWFQHIMHPRFHAASPLGKRILDLVITFGVGIFAVPVLGLCAIAIKATDGGSILYRQRRVGEGGESFEILKLRTMREDAEAGGAQWAAALNDPRTTRVGNFLRRTHVDELPQLWNVLRGQMSIVGPRPERPEFVRALESELPFYDRRVLVKPGVTGWAQVSCGYAGTEVGTVWKLAHDLFYLKHRSVLFDLLIVVETLATSVRDARRAGRLPAESFVRRAQAVARVEAQARNL
jgi:exopolysaccharide biosynthesis polyprenyl glycosylphosphotransferase